MSLYETMAFILGSLVDHWPCGEASYPVVRTHMEKNGRVWPAASEELRPADNHVTETGSGPSSYRWW